MPRRVHPRPWLRVVERIVIDDRLAQVLKGDVVVATMIFNSTVQHGSGNTQNGARLVVENQAIRWDVTECCIELGALYVGRVVYTDVGGVFTLQSTSGRATDICDALP